MVPADAASGRSDRSGAARGNLAGDILADAPERAVLLVLDQVTDPHNVGAIPAPLRHSVRWNNHPGSARAAGSGATQAASGALNASLVRVVNPARALEEIAEAGFWRIGLAGEAANGLKEALAPSAWH
jgi:23S rRNA (guanosine2251-2'-O)-methyltransferase